MITELAQTVFLTFILCLIIGFVAYWKNVLDFRGTLTAVVFGLLIGVAGGITWLLLLLLFLAASFVATKFKFESKKRLGVQEGLRGERGWRNVVANGIVPLAIALFSNLPVFPHQAFAFLYLTALASAASDTLASEIGVLSDKVYLITNFKPVKQGTNGGISLLGELWAFNGSLFVAVVGMAFLATFGEIVFCFENLLLISLLGFLGCQIDSFFGATLENKGLLTKGTNNLLSIGLTTVIGMVIVWL